MGLPGKPTFTDIRTSIATHARNTHNSDNRQKVAKFMCHDTSTADKFYAMNLSSKQAVEHRRLFEEALVGVEVSPSKPAEERQPLKRRAKSKHGGKAKRAKRAASPPDSPPSTSDSEEEAVRYQESGVSSLESPSSLEEYPTHLEHESSVADPSSSSEPRGRPLGRLSLQNTQPRNRPPPSQTPQSPPPQSPPPQSPPRPSRQPPSWQPPSRQHGLKDLSGPPGGNPWWSCHL
nr:basic salivary proline-rich protein 1-like [Misgurnus anguillicaudatus]